jgi:hypothetical protein
MQFCPECHFMVYTKLSNDSKDGDDSEMSLINYCKNCSWTGVLEETGEAIYKRNYENDFIADRILNNQYTIYDNALPRLNIACSNDNCITNLDLNEDVTFIIHNLPETIEDSEIDGLLNTDSDAGKVQNNTRLRLTSVAVTTSSNSDKESLMQNYDGKMLDGNELKTEDYTKPDNEVLYIKYDPENMKYLYMCVNCGSSWQGNY